jgi:hypothetical protein
MTEKHFYQVAGREDYHEKELYNVVAKEKEQQ